MQREATAKAIEVVIAQGKQLTALFQLPAATHGTRVILVRKPDEHEMLRACTWSAAEPQMLARLDLLER